MRPLARVVGGVAALAAAVLGTMSLAAWRLGGWRMAARLGPDGIAMGPITALFLVVLGLSLGAMMLRPDSKATRYAGLLSSSFAFLASALVAAQSWRPVSLPWDRWLLGGDRLVGAIVLGRMPLSTIAAFLLVSTAFAAQLVPFRNRPVIRRIGSVSATLSALIGMIAVAGWASGIPRYLSGPAAPMAMLTGVALIALNGGILLLAGWDETLKEWLAPALEVEIPQGQGRLRRRELVTVAAVVAFILLSTLVYLRREQADARHLAYQQLDAIASLKAEEIAGWRAARLREARFLLEASDVMKDAAAFIVRPGGQSERAQLLDWLNRIRDQDGQESALVFDAQGTLLLEAPGASGAVTSLDHPSFTSALAGRDVVTTDLYRSALDGRIYLDLVAPIRAIGVIVLRVDPYRYLFPLVQSWPVPSDTAEAVLVRREGDDAVYLTPLRHQPDAPLNFRRPMTDLYLPAAIGLRGEAEVREGLDYHGAAVLAAARRIPGTPWLLVVKIDQSETYEPVRRDALQTGVMVGLLLLAVVLASGFTLRQRQSDSMLRALIAERERGLLDERLALVTRHANDIILLTDVDGRVVEANDRALATYGYTLDEIRALPGGSLRPPETAAGIGDQLSLVDQKDGAVFETLHRRRDGSIFPAEVSGRAVIIGERRLLLAVIRDITQRRAHEAEIGRLNRLYAAHSQVNQAIVHADTGEGLLHEVCRCLVEFGRFPMAWVGRHDLESGCIEPVAHFGDASGYLRDIRITLDETPEGRGPAGTAIRENRAIVCNDFLRDPRTEPWHEAARRAGFGAVIALPVRLEEGDAGALVVYAAEAGFFGAQEVVLIEEAAVDISFGIASLDRESQRARAEEALSKSEERLRLALAAGHQGLYDLNVLTGHEVVSAEYATMLGYDPKTFRETTAAWTERLHPDDRSRAGLAYTEYIAGRSPGYRVEFRQRTRAGDWRWILSMAQIVERTADGQPLRILGTHTDITDLKRAEAAVAASEVRYRRLFESSKDGILILDAATGMVVDVNPFLIELLGFSREALLGKAIWDLGFFRDIVPNQDGFAELQNQEYIRYEDKPLKTADGRRIDVEFISNVYMVDDHKVIQCNIRDITDRRRAEIALRVSLHEKEALLKEVHHRVKNNLQVITSLLRLEASRAGEPSTKVVLKDMQSRIRSMALLHETLYRTGNFARVDLAEYLRQLATQLFRTQNAEPSRIQLVMELAAAPVEIDQAIPCGLMVNELLTNSLKYAFVDGRAGEVRLGLQRNEEGEIRLAVIDTGTGLPQDFEARKHRSLGLQLVSDLVRQLAGTLKIGPGPGASFTAIFRPHNSAGDEGIPS